MSYELVEERMHSLMLNLTPVFSKAEQLTRGDWRVMNLGKSPCGIFYPGALPPATPLTAESWGYHYHVNFDFYYRFKDDGKSMREFEELRDKVLQHMQAYPTLNHLSSTTEIEGFSGSDVIELYSKEGQGPYYLAQTLTWTILDYVQVTLLEGS